MRDDVTMSGWWAGGGKLGIWYVIRSTGGWRWSVCVRGRGGGGGGEGLEGGLVK